MNYVMYREPFPHLTVDDFLDEQTLSDLLAFRPRIGDNLLGLGINNDSNYIQCKSKFFQDGKEEHYIDDPIFSELFYDYHGKLISVLEQLCPDNKRRIEYTEISLAVFKPPMCVPRHTDTEDKLLSVVVYLSENNRGTILYRGEQYAREVQWKQNRAFAFVRTEDTWHSFETDGTERYTLMINFKGHQ